MLRLLLIVVALVLAAGSLISDQIVGAVVIVPALLVSVIVSIACLGADLVRPRVRVAVACSALSVVAPFPFLLLGRDGIRAGAIALVVLQVVPLVRARMHPGADAAAGPRRVVAGLVISTALLLVTVAALVWYGTGYLSRPPPRPSRAARTSCRSRRRARGSRGRRGRARGR